MKVQQYGNVITKNISQRIDCMAMDIHFLVRKEAKHEADIFEFKTVKGYRWLFHKKGTGECTYLKEPS